MPNQTKPDVTVVWASDGQATPVPLDKQALGYIEEIPFFDDFNGHMQQISQFMKHVSQEGIAVWDNKTVYAIGSYAKSPVDFHSYRALSENSNTPPVTTAGGAVNPAWIRWTYTLPEMLDEISGVFCGMVVPIATPTPPAGFLLADGRAVSRVTYARLFARIGTASGPGNGTTTFNLPDMRGETVRGQDLGRGVDPDRAFMSAQAGAVGRHAHFIKTSVGSPGTDWTLPDNLFSKQASNPNPVTGEYARTYQDSDEGSFANENRVRNIAIPYYIKY